ncbi:CarD-like protein [Peptostreptococcaceae bacterium oral taxon 113 str. W5053]|nr:CarD-like protein [Peptostreptococcaceae bacterium oral taxon 113 str. W5053]
MGWCWDLVRITEREIKMFNIGDKIVHPMHGAGVIECVEEKDFLGEKKNYYKIKMVLRGIDISIPIDKIEKLGLRSVMDNQTKETVKAILGGRMGDMPENWNQRYRANLELIKTGDVRELAVVVRNLFLLDMEKGLSAGEKKMLNVAKQMMISEIMILENREALEIEREIDCLIKEISE